VLPHLDSEAAAQHHARRQRRRSQRDGDRLAEIEIGNALGDDVGAGDPLDLDVGQPGVSSLAKSATIFSFTSLMLPM